MKNSPFPLFDKTTNIFYLFYLTYLFIYLLFLFLTDEEKLSMRLKKIRSSVGNCPDQRLKVKDFVKKCRSSQNSHLERENEFWGTVYMFGLWTHKVKTC